MREKGYTSIDDFRGKIKEWSKEGVALSRSAKAAKKSTENTTIKKTESEDHRILIAVLFAIIALLLADKFNFGSL
jgi:hypothetical protein